MAQGVKKNTDFKTACIFLLGHFIDSGYGAALLVCLTLVALAFVTTQGMASADRLKLLQNVMALPIWTWLGWVAAIVVTVTSRFLLKQQRDVYNRSLKQADEAKAAVFKQAEFPLETPHHKP